MLQLEKFSYYQHLSLAGGRERPILAGRIVDIRGTRFHVLSRIQDAGLDFTGRTNFIAHHLVFTPEEIRRFALPPVILRHWPGWVTSWAKEPQLLENEDWTELAALAGRATVPAETWQRVTGDAVNGYGLLETRAGAALLVDDQPGETVLDLLAEGLALLEIRDPRRDGHATAWNYTFTTSMQEQDNPADFRWRCIHSDNPAAHRFATPDGRALSAVRALKCTAEEAALARTGRQAPQFVTEPEDARTLEGGAVSFTARAEGVPAPTYQWYSVDRADQGRVLPGETNAELVLASPTLGLARYRVSATNSAGTVQSRVAKLSVDEKLKLAPTRPNSGPPAARGDSHQKSEEEIDRQRQRLEAEREQAEIQKRRWYRIVILFLMIVLCVPTVIGALILKGRKPPAITAQPVIQTNQENQICITIVAKGAKPLFYQLFKASPMDLLLSSTNSTLPVKELVSTNPDSFRVVVTNFIGAVTSGVVQWSGMAPPPVISETYKDDGFSSKPKDGKDAKTNSP